MKNAAILSVAWLLSIGLGLGAVAQAEPAADIQVLQQQVKDLQARVSLLEKKMFRQQVGGEGAELTPKPGGWKVGYNWQLMRSGLDRHQVRERLGEPENSHAVGKFTIWEYGDGQVKFYLGRVSSFEPATLK